MTWLGVHAWHPTVSMLMWHATALHPLTHADMATSWESLHHLVFAQAHVFKVEPHVPPQACCCRLQLLNTMPMQAHPRS